MHSSPCRYKGPDHKKLYGPILERLHAKFLGEQMMFLKKKSSYGRALTGDAATILNSKFINFLCHEYGKGAMLCAIRDCSRRLLEVGSVESLFIAHEMINVIRYFVHCPL